MDALDQQQLAEWHRWWEEAAERARTEEQARFTDEELAELQRRFEQANTPAAQAAHIRREMHRLLSRRTRFWLWRHKQLTSAGIWLADHAGQRACVALWRVTGLWGGR